MPRFENNGKSRVGRSQLLGAKLKKKVARNIGRMMFLKGLAVLPDDEQERKRKKKQA